MPPGAITGSRPGYSPSVPTAGRHHRRRCPLGSRDGTSPPCLRGCPAWSDAPRTPGRWQCAGWPASCCCQNTSASTVHTPPFGTRVSLYSTCTTAIWDMRQSSTQYSTHTTAIWDTRQLLSVQYTHHRNLGHTSVIQSVQYTHHCNLGHTSVSTVHTPPQFGTHFSYPVSTVHMPPAFRKLIQYGPSMRVSLLITSDKVARWLWGLVAGGGGGGGELQY